MFGPGSFPHWMHGYGSRITRLRVIDDATLVARLDEAAEAAR
jgi:hypothetical protein